MAGGHGIGGGSPVIYRSGYGYSSRVYKDRLGPGISGLLVYYKGRKYPIRDYVEAQRIDPLIMVLETVNKDDENEKIPGLTFEITSEIEDYHKVKTNTQGLAEAKLNEPEIEFVEYTIHYVDKPEALPDIKVRIGYTFDNYIEEAMIIEGDDIAEIIGEYVGTRKIKIRIKIDEDKILDDYRYEMTFIKSDEDSPHIKLEGVQYNIDIVKESGVTKNHIATTNEKGIISDRYFTTYGETTYTITEIESIRGYVKDETPKTIIIGRTLDHKAKIIQKPEEFDIVQSDVSKEIKIKMKNKVNDTEYAGITIEKVDSEDFDIKIPYVEFSVYDETTHETYLTETNEEGYAKILIPIVKEDAERFYTITETKIPEGYEEYKHYIGGLKLRVRYDENGIKEARFHDPDHPEINEIAEVINVGNNLIDVRVKNERNNYIVTEIGSYNVKIVKIDENNIGIIKPGADLTVDISNSKGMEHITKTGVTDENGVIKINGIAGCENIRIDIKENLAPENMELDTSPKWITLYRHETTGKITHTASQNVFYDIDNSTRTVTVFVTNRLKDNMFTIVMNKLDKNDEGIKDVEFELTLPDESKIEKIVTIKNGFTFVSGINMPEEPGEYTYKIKEVSAPEKYKLLEDEIEVKVTFEFDEERDKMYIANVVDDSDYCQLIDTQYINLESDDGKISKAKTENTTGKPLADNCFEFDILNDELDSVGLQIEKVDKQNHDKKLKGAVYKIEIKDIDTNEVIKTIERTAESNSDGIIKVNSLRLIGNLEFTIKEIKSPKGYKVDTDENNVVKTFKLTRSQTDGSMRAISGITQAELDNENGLINIQIENELRDGELTVKINKTKEDGTALKGAEFTIVQLIDEQEVEGTKLTTEATDDDGLTSKTIDLPKNNDKFIYRISETKTPDGYKKSDDKIIEVTSGVRDDGTYGPKSVKVDGESTTIVEDEIEVEVMNRTIKSFKLEINTSSKEDTDKKLSGAKYKITVKDVDKDEIIKEIEETGESDSLGNIIISEITDVGNFEITISQTATPKGYKKVNDKVVKITAGVRDDGTYGAKDAKVDEVPTEITDDVIKVDVQNEEFEPFNIEITTVRTDNTDKKLSGAKYKITVKDIDTDEIIKEITETDASDNVGKILTEDIKGVGNLEITITQTTYPSGYKKPESVTESTLTKVINIERNVETGIMEAQDTNPEYTINNDSRKISLTIENELKDGEVTIEINKVTENNIALKGAEFSIVQIENGQEVAGTKVTTSSTDDNGVTSKTIKLPKDKDSFTYKVTETKIPNGYKKADDKIVVITTGIGANNSYCATGVTIDGTPSIILNENNQDKIVIKVTDEEIKPFNIELTTVSKANTEKKLSGAKYKVIVKDLDENVVIKEITETVASDNLGKILTEDINNVGNLEITITQTTYPNGYKKPEDETGVTLTKVINIKRNVETGIMEAQDTNPEYTIDNDSRKVSLIIKNELKDGELMLQINKLKEDNSALPGAEFSIVQIVDNQELVDSKVVLTKTDTDGKTSTTIKLPTDKTELKYKLTETKIPKGYKKADDRIIEITAGEQDDGTFGAKMVKVDGTVVAIEKETIEGVEYEKALAKIIDNAIEPFKLEITTVKDSDNTKKLAGAEYEVTIEDLDAEPGTTPTVINTETAEAGVISRANDGTLIINGIKPVGNIRLTVKETTYPKGYQKPQSVQENTVTKVINISRSLEDGTIESKDTNPEYTVDNTSNLNRKITITVENELKDGEITIAIKKVNNNNVALKGAGFSIVQIDNNQEIANTKQVMADTDDSGVTSATIKLPKDKDSFTYKITETKMPKGYKKADDNVVVITADVRADGTYGATGITIDGVNAPIVKETIEGIEKEKVVAQIINEEIEPFKLEINTVNKDNTNKKLTGAEYEITIEDLDAEPGSTPTVINTETAGPIVITKNINGTITVNGIKEVGNLKITVKETKYPDGYGKPEDYTLDTVTKVIRVTRSLEDGTIEDSNEYTVDNNDSANRKVSVTIENETIAPELEVTINKVNNEQVNDDDKAPLKDAQFTIRKDSTAESEATTLIPTNDAGLTKVLLTLPKEEKENTYIIKEITAPIGYLAKTEEMTLKVKVKKMDNESFKVDSIIWESTEENVQDAKASIEVENKLVVPYRIELITQDDDTQNPYAIEGAKYDITVTNTTMDIEKEFLDVTADELGKILTDPIYGIGDIEIKVQQKEISDNYIKNQSARIVKIQRDNQGNITEDGIRGNKIAVTDIDNDNTSEKKIQITMINELMKPYKKINIKKVDKKDFERELRGAKFKVQLPAIVLTENNESIMNIDMSDKSKEELTLPLPKSEGTFEYIIREENAPQGYKKLEVPMTLTIVVKKQNGLFVADNINVKNAGSRMVSLMNGEIVVANERKTEEQPYNIMLEFSNLNNAMKINVEVQSNNGAYSARNELAVTRNITMKEIIGTGNISLRIYDITHNKEAIITYYRDPITNEISNITPTEISDFGSYYIVTEKNDQGIKIRIFDPTKCLDSSLYSVTTVSDTEGLVRNVNPNTTVSELISNVSTNQDYVIEDTDGSTINVNQNNTGLRSSFGNDSLVKTGTKLKVGNMTYTVAVTGDIDGDGKLLVNDVIRINLSVAKLRILTGVYEFAADVNFDDEVSVLDVIHANLVAARLIEL